MKHLFALFLLVALVACTKEGTGTGSEMGDPTQSFDGPGMSSSSFAGFSSGGTSSEEGPVIDIGSGSACLLGISTEMGISICYEGDPDVISEVCESSESGAETATIQEECPANAAASCDVVYSGVSMNVKLYGAVYESMGDAACANMPGN